MDGALRTAALRCYLEVGRAWECAAWELINPKSIHLQIARGELLIKILALELRIEETDELAKNTWLAA